MRLEVLTQKFFVELIRHMGSHLDLVVLRRSEEVVAVGWLLHTEKVFDMLFVGVRDDLKPEMELYFNVMYAAFDCALRHGTPLIRVGQTAPFFKTRLGSGAERRYVFAKGARPFIAWLFRNVIVKTIPKPEPLPTLRVFRVGPSESTSLTRS